MTAKTTAPKPARKGTVRTTNGPAAPVKTKRASAAVKAGAPAKLANPTTRRAAKPAAKATAAKPASDAKVIRREVIDQVVKLRKENKKWGEISEETGMTLSALARVRATAKRDGIWL
jgi:hypothetical protein